MRTRRALGLLLPVVLVASGLAVVTSGGPASAADGPELEPYYSQVPALPGDDDGTALTASSLPAQVTLQVRSMDQTDRLPQNTPYRFSLRLPMTQQVDAGTTTREEGGTNEFPLFVYDSAATFTVPAGTACGTYPTRVANRAQNNDLVYADGYVRVQGCAREFYARRPVVTRTVPGPVEFQFAGRYFPGVTSDPAGDTPNIVIAVDGSTVATVPAATSDQNDTVFDRRVQLDLACGQHTVTASTGPSGVLESRPIEVRCASLDLSSDAAEREDLPLDLGLAFEGLADDLPYVLRLDGEAVGEGTPDKGGGGSGTNSIQLPAALPCGLHEVQIEQFQPEPAPFPNVNAPPPPGPAAQPPPNRQPPPIPLRKAPPSKAVVGDPDYAIAVAPFTVICPGFPYMTVTPELVVDTGAPATYAVTAVGYADDSPLTLTAGGQTQTLPPPGRTDAIGRFAGPVKTRLPCGPATFRLTDATGLVGADAVQVRCPELVLVPGSVPKASLPRNVPAKATGFASNAFVDLLLDGVDVGDGRTNGAGSLTLPLAAPGNLPCGAHTVTVRQRSNPFKGATAAATLSVVCSPVIEVSPEVVATGFTARVTGSELPPGPLTLVWDMDGLQRPAMRRDATVAPDGTLRLSVLLLRSETTGPRTLFGVNGDGFNVTDAETTLVVLSPFQPGRRSPAGGINLLGRR